VDFIAAPLVATTGRSKVLDFTIPFTESPAVCMIPAPEEMNKLTAILQPFHSQVLKKQKTHNLLILFLKKSIFQNKKIWTLGIFSLFIVAAVALVTTRSNDKLNTASSNNTIKPTFGHQLLVILGVICNQRNIIKQIYTLDKNTYNFTEKYNFFF